MQNQTFPQNQDDSNIPDYLRTSSTTPRPKSASPFDNPAVSASDTASTTGATEDPNAAANLIRQKIAALYGTEPDAKQEAAEVANMYVPLSPHQEYMRTLQTSGRSWAEIQNAWHAYYQGLTDAEKHQVWQEFYASSRAATPFQQHMQQRDMAHGTAQAAQSAPAVQGHHPIQGAPSAAAAHTLYPAQTQMPLPSPQPASYTTPPHQYLGQGMSTAGLKEPDERLHSPIADRPQHLQEAEHDTPFQIPHSKRATKEEEYAGPASHAEEFKPAIIPATYAPVVPSAAKPAKDRPSVADLKKRIRHSVSAGGKLKKTDHLKSLGFGLATGAIVVFIFLFGFFNEVFITPFIQPSRQATAPPIIMNTASAPVSATPEVIIPKINVEIPVDYSQTTIDESAIENALDKGVVHYPTTVMPGQAGNAAFFGHSSNNIFNPGKYKFAFVLLHKLVEGDTFYLTYNGKTYVYQVISRRVVDPSEVGVLGPVPNETATATLITCDPPGTSLKRLIVVGRQISPDPSGNATPAAPTPQVAEAGNTATSLPGNGPTLWSRLWHSIF